MNLRVIVPPNWNYKCNKSFAKWLERLDNYNKQRYEPSSENI